MITYHQLNHDRIAEYDVRDINRLLTQLASRPRVLDRMTLANIAQHSHILVARDQGGPIRGMATLCTVHTPTKKLAIIEDVVVDESLRGQGIGEALMQRLIAHARERSVRHIDLTSQPARFAANHLYGKLGFALRETNHYRLSL